MRTIAIINQKGGCGKTTTAINLAATLARNGKRVLLVDMDPQSHCAAGLGIPENRIELDIGDAMLAAGQRPLDPARLLWRAARNLDLAPSRMKLAGLEAARGGLAELVDKERRLASVLHQFRHDYDLACIDCPPTIGLLTYNALAAADFVLIPVETSFFSLQGATKQVNTIKTLARRLGVQLPTWLLPTIHEAGNAVALDLLEELHRRFKDRVTPVVIRRDAALREAASFGQPAADYAPDSMGTADYARLATWLREQLDGKTEVRTPIDPVETHAEHHETPEEPHIHVPAISPRVLAERAPADAAVTPEPPAPDAPPEIKPITRAEDVARRAQDFLRRVAQGRSGVLPVSPEPAPSALIAPPQHTAVTPASGAGAPLRLIPDPPAAEAGASVRRLFGIRETNQGILFVQPLASGQSVAVAGSFNNWSATSHVLRRNSTLGVWELCVRLPPGQIRYRLVIDGLWAADPYNDHCEPNPFGETDSVFTVGGHRLAEQTA